MTTSIAERTAANLRAEVARQGVTQGRLAEVLDLSQTAVSARLRGRTPLQLWEIERLAFFLAVPVSALVPVEEVTA